MNIILMTIITVKMTELGELLNRFVFIVRMEANKVQIKQAVEALYGVEVESVNTMNIPGKFKSRYTKTGLISGRPKARKKAIITLAKGETIDFYSNI